VRRALLICAAVLGAAAALGAGLWAGARGAEASAPADRVRLVLQWAPQAQFAGYYLALEKGFYRDHGLDVEIIPGGPAIDSLTYLSDGKAEFATAFLTGAISASGRGGARIVDVCQVVNRSNLLLVAHRERVKDRDDLDGARVSLWGSGFRSAYEGFFAAAQVKPKILPQYYSVNLFLLGGADACAAMDYNEYETIVDSGVDPGDLTVFSMQKNGFGFPEDGVYATAATVRRDPQQCREFAAATLQGWAYCRAHPGEAVDSVMRHAREAHVPTNRVHQRWMLDHILTAIYPGERDAFGPGVLSRVDYERTRAVMIGQGLIDAAPSYDDFVLKGASRAP
jgi:NitT/TauT family transport system substrate-binding protein